MAFAASGLNCIAVGPTKVYTYYTTDTLTSASVLTNFNTTNCPGMAVGDRIDICHNTYALFAPIRITAIDATSCTYTGVTALA
ncbi:MAG: hypothetical protein WC332_03325 [Clostridia bacterium]|jgi:hypothetical protein